MQLGTEAASHLLAALSATTAANAAVPEDMAVPVVTLEAGGEALAPGHVLDQVPGILDCLEEVDSLLHVQQL